MLWFTGSREDFFKVFTIYGHGGHLGQVTSIMLMNFHFHVIKSLHVYTIWLKKVQWFFEKNKF